MTEQLILENENVSKKLQQEELAEAIKFSKRLHNYMRDYVKLSETEKPLLVSGVLIALHYKPFRTSYKRTPDAQQLADNLVGAINQVLVDSDIDEEKIRNTMYPYSFIQVHPELTKGDVLKVLIDEVKEHIFDKNYAHSDFDIIGNFYGEFLRYTGGDKKGLGIVLTPKHITDLFSDIAEVNTNSVVLDTCTGTGGFLISAMLKMFELAKEQSETEEEFIELRENIRKNGLVGVEQQSNMFAMAASNMILRGDGKSNLHLGSCFDGEIIQKIREQKPTVGLINPPYSQKGENMSELHFIDHMLDLLEPNGIGVAIVPMSCAIDTKKEVLKVREQILSKHTLKAVMSMPDEVFHGVGTVTCIMVFEAHKPHDTAIPSWFGYWKEDGFEKTKTNGRVDLYGKWEGIREFWLDMYHNQKEVLNYSVLKEVSAADEWCAEAYMETDYSTLTAQDFEEEMKKYVMFKLMNGVD